MIVLLAVGLPMLVAAGLLARRPIPRMERLPEGLVGFASDSSAVGATRVASWDGGSLRASLLVGVDDAAPAVSIELLQELERPDLLVYWSGDLDAVSERVPGDAVLLGSLAGRHPTVFRLPVEASGTDGQLFLHSPTQGEVVTSFRFSVPAVADDGDSE